MAKLTAHERHILECGAGGDCAFYEPEWAYCHKLRNWGFLEYLGILEPDADKDARFYRTTLAGLAALSELEAD